MKILISMLGLLIIAVIFLRGWALIRANVIFIPYKISDKDVAECAEYQRIESFVWLTDCKFGKKFSRVPYTEIAELKQ